MIDSGIIKVKVHVGREMAFRGWSSSTKQIGRMAINGMVIGVAILLQRGALILRTAMEGKSAVYVAKNRNTVW